MQYLGDVALILYSSLNQYDFEVPPTAEVEYISPLDLGFSHVIFLN